MTVEKKPHIVRNTILVLVVCGIVGLVLTAWLFFGHPNPTGATATVQFSFEGAADGIAPDGSKFDIKEMSSDQVLEEALKAASMSDRYTAEQIRPHLVLEGKYPEDMAEQVKSYESLLNFTASRELTVTDFHATTFHVTLYNEFDKAISEADLRALLESIVSTYRAYFAEKYSYSLLENALYFELQNYDYPQQLDIIQTQLELLEDYAGELYEKEPSFRLNGQGFNDIMAQLRAMIESDVSRISADLTMNALTRNTARLLTQYQYAVRNLTNQVEKQTAQLEQLDALIGSYEKNEIIYLSTNDALTKIDGNSSLTYDVLVDQRKEVADNITDLNSQMTEYQLKMADLLKDTSAASTASENVAAKAETKASEEHTAAGDTAAAQKETPDKAAGKTTNQNVPAETGAENAQAEAEVGAEIAEMSEEEIAAAAEEAEKLARRQIENLNKNIEALVEKKVAIVAAFKALLNAYNEQEINDATVSAFRFDYNTPEVLSGAFVKAAIKTAGPICAVGFMLCMVWNILVLKKREKRK